MVVFNISSLCSPLLNLIFICQQQKTKDLEFYNKRLNEKNIGFQILQKMGWQEGRGLGLHGKGIQDPVEVYV